MSIFREDLRQEIEYLINKLGKADFQLPPKWLWWEKKKLRFNQIEQSDVEIIRTIRTLHKLGKGKPELNKKIIQRANELAADIERMKRQVASVEMQRQEAILVNNLIDELKLLLGKELKVLPKKPIPLRISVITSMYNKKESTLKAVEELFFKSLIKNPPSNKTAVELIIIDDCSPLQEETKRLVEKYMPWLKQRFYRVVFERNPVNYGFSKSFNRGIGLAKGNILITMHDDVYLTKDAIELLASAIYNNPEYGVMGPITYQPNMFTFQHCKQGPKIKSYAAEEFTKIEKFALSVKKLFWGRICQVDVVTGFCFATTRAVTNKFGAFDEYFGHGYYEDTDFVRRIARKYKIGVAPYIYVHHGDRRGASVSMKQNPLKSVFALILNTLRYGKRWGYGQALKHNLLGIYRAAGKRSISTEVRGMI